MGAVLYLALVGGGLTAAFLATVVLRGIRLI
ncbi:MAG: cytochrome b6-f complex subunit 6 [Synechococcaceae cyanobacterium]|nr:cytochrome b6-f complex subunit 6 [Synechococcaceae cyanobacterium]